MKRHGVLVSPSHGMGAAFNPAAAQIGFEEFVMLVRSIPTGYQKIGPVNSFADYTSHLSLWRSANPHNFNQDASAGIYPDQPYDRYGVEDARITKIGDSWYICYTALAVALEEENSGRGIRIALASTRDFKTFTKHGIIGPDIRSKAGTLFESGGRIHFLWKDEEGVERTMLSPAPVNFENAQAWQHLWTDETASHHQLLGPQDNDYEGHGVEPGAPPIEIEEGLLMVYSSISHDFKWSISLMLLDKKEPGRILSKSARPILMPEADYELTGDVRNVVFPCGALIHEDRLHVYYGAADTVCAMASKPMSEIMAALQPFEDRPRVKPYVKIPEFA